MDKILREKELTPVFRIENYYCYTIWLAENREKNIFIYYTIFDHLIDIYETSKRFLIKNKTFNKVKSLNSDFFTFQTVKSEKGKYYNKNILKNGKLSIYNKKLNKIKSDKFRSLISKIDKGLYSCSIGGDPKISNNKISLMKISSHQLRFNALRLDYPFITNEKLKEKYYRFYQDDNCIDFKLLVDYVFELATGDK